MLSRLIIVGLLFLLLACSEEPVTPKTGSKPEIVSVRLPDRWTLNSIDSNIVEITVIDPQGFADLETVMMQVFNASSEQVFSGQLYDDGGLSGSMDLIAADGVFRNVFVGSDISQESGDFLFTFNISDKTGNAAMEFSKTAAFSFNQSPQIISATTLSVLESGMQSLVLNVIARDDDSPAENVNVYLDLRLNNTSIFNEPIQLANDGNIAENGDAFANDTIYSLIIDSTFAAGKSGNHTLVFFARDEFDDESNPVENDIFIENEKGYIITTEVPDTVFRPADIPIKALVGDPQGLDDIQRVYFELKASDGTYIETGPGSRFQQNMFDSGNLIAHGDTTAGDAEYSVILSVTESNVADVYTLEFYMVDKVSNVSLMVSDTLDIQ